MSTTIVEIDPAVYQAARSYFGLRDPGVGRVFLEDAGAWIENRSMQTAGSDELFDIVVHDCFSGGGVPEHIYTAEFWRALKVIMHPEGVLAVVRPYLSTPPFIHIESSAQNFAGVPVSNSSRAILFTLEDAFGPCRGFYDSFETLTEAAYTTDFINIVSTYVPPALSFR